MRGANGTVTPIEVTMARIRTEVEIDCYCAECGSGLKSWSGESCQAVIVICAACEQAAFDRGVLTGREQAKKTD